MTTTTTALPARRLTGLQGWLHAWKLALRLGWRDAVRHRGRSGVIVAMVLLPVMLLTLAGSLAQTLNSPPDRSAYTLGNALGTIDLYGGVHAMAEKKGGKGLPRTLAGYATYEEEIERRTGGTVILDGTGWAQVTLPNGRVLPSLGGRAVDARNPIARPFAELLRGRWPATPTEIVVTPRGIKEGLPDTGTVQLSLGGGKNKRTATMTVVGVGQVSTSDGRMASYQILPSVAINEPGADLNYSNVPPFSQHYLLQRNAPPTAAQAREWHDAGVQVRDGRNRLWGETLAPHRQPWQDDYERSNFITTFVAFIAGVLVLGLLMTMLVGPAFAISAARQRRAVALAVLNGATSQHARRTLLAQALILGSAASVLGTILGVTLVAVGWPVAQTHFPDAVPTYAAHYPWLWLLLMALFGGLTACIAAVLPARSLSGLAVNHLSRRPGADEPAPSWHVLLGAVLFVAGAGLGLTAPLPTWDTNGNYRYAWAAVGCVLLVFGALFLLSWVLQRLAASAGRLPVAARLAVRDASRHRRRTVPAMAAIAISVALATGVSILGVTSLVTGLDRRTQTTPLGWVYAQDPASTSAIAEVKKASGVEPAVVYGEDATQGKLLRLINPFCTPRPWPVAEDSIIAEIEPDGPCIVTNTRLYIGAPEDLGRLGALHPDEVEALRGGTLLVGDPALARNGTVGARFVTPRSSTKVRAALPVTQLPARTLSSDRMDGAWARPVQENSVLVPRSVADAHGVALTLSLVAAPPVDVDAARTAVQTATAGTSLNIEEGSGEAQQRALILFALLVPVLLIVLISVLSTTALTLHEQREDHATQAAMGATSRLRRHLAVAYAGTTALLGSASGVLVGTFASLGLMVGDVAMAVRGAFTSVDPALELGASRPVSRWETLQHFPYPMFPWEWCFAALVVVPLVAALSATLLTRRDPALTRRRD